VHRYRVEVPASACRWLMPNDRLEIGLQRSTIGIERPVLLELPAKGSAVRDVLERTLEAAAEASTPDPGDRADRTREPRRTPGPPRASGPLPRLAPPDGLSKQEIQAWWDLRKLAHPHGMGGSPEACIEWVATQQAQQPAAMAGLLASVESGCRGRQGDREGELAADRRACAAGIERSCVYLEQLGLR